MTLHETLCPVAAEVLRAAPVTRPARHAKSLREIEEDGPRVRAVCVCGRNLPDSNTGIVCACGRKWGRA
jgi:hypothetical protein